MSVVTRLDDIGYRGWMQIESAVPKGMPMPDAYKATTKFLRGIFALSGTPTLPKQS